MPSRASTWSILDTIGELAQLYQVATVVFVGGSLVDAGGHNILEPAVFGKPIVFGPHMHNFAEIARTFLENRGAIQVQADAELEDVLRRAAGRSGPPRGSRRRRAGAGRGQPRRPRARPSPCIAQLLPSGCARHGAAVPRAC